MNNLRKQNKANFGCIYTTRASSLGSPEKPYTTQLKKGTTGKAVAFALQSAENGFPLNTLFTLRWHALFAEDADYRYLSLPTRERIAKSVELIRKFLTYRGVKFPWIWVQENTVSNKGLHWHLAFHCPSEVIEELVQYIEKHFGIERLPDYLNKQKKRGEVARSVLNAWQLAIDDAPEWQGIYLALYLSKGEGRGAEFSDTVKSHFAHDVRLKSQQFMDSIKRERLSLPIYKLEAFSATIKKRHFNKPQGIVEGTQKDRFAIARLKF